MALSPDVRDTGAAAVSAPEMQQARARIFAAFKTNKIFFLNSMSPSNIVDMLKEGVMIGPANREAAEIGRRFTKREMPW